MARNLLIYLYLFIFALSVGYASSNKCQLKQMKADVSFILDCSSSLNDSDFQTMLKFIENFIDSVTIGQNNVRLATAIYAYYQIPKFTFGDYLNEKALKNAVHNIKRFYGGTYTHLGLRWVLQQFTNKTVGARTSIRHLGILITDGHSHDANKTKAEAIKLHKENVEMIAIGVTNDVRKEELSSIASGENNVFILDNFNELSLVETCFQNRLCKGLLAANNSAKPWTASTCMKSMPSSSTVVNGNGFITMRSVTQQQTISAGQKTFATKNSIAKTAKLTTHLATQKARPTSISPPFVTQSARQNIQATSTINHSASQSRMTKRRTQTISASHSPSLTIYKKHTEKPEFESMKMSNYPKLWQIAVLAGSSLAFMGAVFCLCYFCCSYGKRCKQNKNDVEVFMISETESKGRIYSRKVQETFASSRVTPTNIPVVAKDKPLPMSEGNTFLF